jgi:hypothetical protein
VANMREQMVRTTLMAIRQRCTTMAKQQACTHMLKKHACIHIDEGMCCVNSTLVARWSDTARSTADCMASCELENNNL